MNFVLSVVTYRSTISETLNDFFIDIKINIKRLDIERGRSGTAFLKRLYACRFCQSNQSTAGGLQHCRDVTLKTHKDALHAFMKPSQLLHYCANNHITGHADLMLRSISHYWNAEPFFW